MTALSNARSGTITPYGSVADEYYDARLHPTCASFRELSELFLNSALVGKCNSTDFIVEVGAGKSLVAPILSGHVDLSNVSLIDSAEGMLRHSLDWTRYGVELIVSDATALPFRDGTVDVLVSSLGDPYNTLDFWTEVARVLAPGARCYFTTPAHEWASRFRELSTLQTAEFLNKNGEILMMPSYTLPKDEQKELLLEAGLRLIEARPSYITDLRGDPAPKLLCAGTEDPILWGYSISI